MHFKKGRWMLSFFVQKLRCCWIILGERREFGLFSLWENMCFWLFPLHQWRLILLPCFCVLTGTFSPFSLFCVSLGRAVSCLFCVFLKFFRRILPQFFLLIFFINSYIYCRLLIPLGNILFGYLPSHPSQFIVYQ